MLLVTETGKYEAGPADILCIFKLPDNKFHVAFLEERPMPGPVQRIEELSFVRLKSKMHHTVGSETLEGAQEHARQMREEISIDDANVLLDQALQVADPVQVLVLPNWVKLKIPLKQALMPHPQSTTT